MAREKGFGQRVREEGGAAVAGKGLGEMPLTLWLIVAAVILYLYIRRANLGIDKHPGEAVTVKPSVPSVFIGPKAPFIGPPAPEGGDVTLAPPPDTRVKNFVTLSPSGGGGSIN